MPRLKVRVKRLDKTPQPVGLPSDTGRKTGTPCVFLQNPTKLEERSAENLGCALLRAGCVPRHVRRFGVPGQAQIPARSVMSPAPSDSWVRSPDLRSEKTDQAVTQTNVTPQNSGVVKACHFLAGAQ